MASAGNHRYAKALVFEQTNDYNSGESNTLVCNNGILYFNGKQLSSNAGNQFDIFTANVITRTSGANIRLESNLVILPYTASIIDPSNSAGQGFQSDGTFLYYNGIQISAFSNIYQDADQLTSNSITPLGNTSFVVHSNLIVDNVMSANTQTITFASKTLHFSNINSPQITFDSTNFNLQPTSNGTNVQFLGAKNGSGSDCNVNFVSTSSSNSVGSDIVNLKFKNKGDANNPAANHTVASIRSAQSTTFNAISGGGTMSLTCRDSAEDGTTLTDTQKIMIHMTTHPTANTVVIAPDTIAKIGIMAGYAPTYTFQIGTGSNMYFEKASNTLGLGKMSTVTFGSNVHLVASGGDRVTISSSVNQAGEKSVVIGADAGTAANVVSIGFGHTGPVAANVVKIGSYSTTTQENSISIGYRPKAGLDGVSIGSNAGTLTGNYNVSIGKDAGAIDQGSLSVAVGWEAGASNQSAAAIAIGHQAGEYTQGTRSVAMGLQAGRTSQGVQAVAIGYGAGSTGQFDRCVSIGHGAGGMSQGTSAIAFGHSAALSNQKANAVAIGYRTGYYTQNTNAIAIGVEAGHLGQYANSIAIGVQSAQFNQRGNAIAIGMSSGYQKQNEYGIALGFHAGFSNQGTQGMAFGAHAGASSQGPFCQAIGGDAGRHGQLTFAIALGQSSGFSNQGNQAVAIGRSAGAYEQGALGIAIGAVAGYSSQGVYGVAIGYEAGQSNQGSGAVCIGYDAGKIGQNTLSVAIGQNAGVSGQRYGGVAIGGNAGDFNQGSRSVAIGSFTGVSQQGQYAIAIGPNTGVHQQGQYAIAIGASAGEIGGQGSRAVAIGDAAGYCNQGEAAVAIGRLSGATSQGINSVAVGISTGQTGQGTNSVAVGVNAGYLNQGDNCVSIGRDAGNITQGDNCVSIGRDAGNMTQGDGAVAIGRLSGLTSQGTLSVAVGETAGETSQGDYSVAIGVSAARYSQGENCISIGRQAGESGGNYSGVICISALGGPLNPGGADRCYIKPIRAASGQSNVLSWNSRTGEITCEAVKTFVIDHPDDKDRYLVHGCLEGPEGGVYYRGRGEVGTPVNLPKYVPNLIKGEPTIQVTPIYNGSVRTLNCSEYSNETNSFDVFGSEGPFYWTFTAKRCDVNVEPLKAETNVSGDGPYLFTN
jgi:hypothetical protein